MRKRIVTQTIAMLLLAVGFNVIDGPLRACAKYWGSVWRPISRCWR